MGERPDVCSVLTAQNKTVGILTCVECEHIITHTHTRTEREHKEANMTKHQQLFRQLTAGVPGTHRTTVTLQLFQSKSYKKTSL